VRPLDIWFALAALGVADAAELAAVEAAAARDPGLARLRGELADVVAWLPVALPTARPPPLGTT
jgi:hypothetical protein